MRKQDQNLEHLQRAPLFEGCSKKELRRLCEQGREAWFNPGEKIVTQGGAAAGFHLIIEGRAKVIVNGQTLKSIGPGSFFGEMAILDGGTRSATVQAERHVKTLVITPWNFKALLQENWRLASAVMTEIVKRTRNLEKSVA